MNQEMIGKFISSLRKENNLTQNELAEKLGITVEESLVERFSTINTNKVIKKIEEKNVDTWQETVLYLIDIKGYTDPEVYKRGNISKQTFSKIRCNRYYQPLKDTAIQMCFGLKLNLDETRDLMNKAGFTLSSSIKRDLVVRYFIEEKIYDINSLNDVLYDMELKIFPIVVY